MNVRDCELADGATHTAVCVDQFLGLFEVVADRPVPSPVLTVGFYQGFEFCGYAAGDRRRACARPDAVIQRLGNTPGVVRPSTHHHPDARRGLVGRRPGVLVDTGVSEHLHVPETLIASSRLARCRGQRTVAPS